MFFVADTHDYKKQYILEYLNKEPMIAVLLAAANFEWTVGRCIMFFSIIPNVELREKLSKCHGLDAYRKFWENVLCSTDSTISKLDKIISNWNIFKDAFNLRHRLIHGRGTCNYNMAKRPIELIILATDELYNFALSRGRNLNFRLPVRRIIKKR